jgi:hypothetical protein
MIALLLAADAAVPPAGEPGQSTLSAPPWTSPLDAEQVAAARKRILAASRRAAIADLASELRRARSIDATGQDLIATLVEAQDQLLVAERERGRLSRACDTLARLAGNPGTRDKLAEIAAGKDAEGQRAAYAEVLKELETTDELLRAAIAIQRANERIKSLEEIIARVEAAQERHRRVAERAGPPRHSADRGRELEIRQLKDRLKTLDEKMKPAQPQEAAEAKPDFEFLKGIPAASAPAKAR